MFGACSGPCTRRFVRVRGLIRAFSGPRARVSAGLRTLFSDDNRDDSVIGIQEPYNCSGSGQSSGSCRETRWIAPGRAFGISIIVRVRG